MEPPIQYIEAHMEDAEGFIYYMETPMEGMEASTDSMHASMKLHAVSRKRSAVTPVGMVDSAHEADKIVAETNHGPRSASRPPSARKAILRLPTPPENAIVSHHFLAKKITTNKH